MKSPTDARFLATYSAPAIPLAMLGMPLIIYVPPFYASELGLDLAAVGGIFFLARLWDALTDPIIGNLSDRTRGKWGRRKPWILFGTPLLMISLYFFLAPPVEVSKVYLFVSAFIFYVAWTIVQIPYLSWGAEMSRDYATRTRITGFRESASMIGIILATLLPVVVLSDENPALRDILWIYVATLTILIPLTTFIACGTTPNSEFVDTGKRNLITSLKYLRKNKPFLRLIVGILFIWLGGSIMNTTLIFMFDHILHMPRSGFLKFVLAQYTLGILFLPLWVKAGNRIGRHRALILGGSGYLFALPLFLLVTPGELSHVLMMALVLGPLSSVIWFMPPALVADTIEYGMMKGGGDDAALYMAVYNFVVKFCFAAGVGIAMPLLGYFSFQPTGENSADALQGLIFIAMFLPALIGIPGAIILYNYPINQHKHTVIRRWLARKNLTEITRDD